MPHDPGKMTVTDEKIQNAENPGTPQKERVSWDQNAGSHPPTSSLQLKFMDRKGQQNANGQVSLR